MPSIPPSMNLGQLPNAIPSIMYRDPKEGAKSVAYDIAWSRPLARGLSCVSVNMQDSSYLEFSQIAGLIVDNSNCGSDLDFIFPDTDVVISIPAYAPYTVLQVNTQQVQFYVRALGALPIDRTDIMVLNYAPAPVAVPITVQQQVAVVSNESIDGAAVTQILPPGTSGTLRGFQLNGAWNGAVANYNDLIRLRDGIGGAVLWSGNIAGSTVGEFSGVLANLSDISIRFKNGLILQQTGGFAVGGTLNANCYYVTP